MYCSVTQPRCCVAITVVADYATEFQMHVCFHEGRHIAFKADEIFCRQGHNSSVSLSILHLFSQIFLFFEQSSLDHVLVVFEHSQGRVFNGAIAHSCSCCNSHAVHFLTVQMHYYGFTAAYLHSRAVLD